MHGGRGVLSIALAQQLGSRVKKLMALFATLVLLASAAPAQATSIAGSKCPRAGATKTVAHVRYRCVRHAKRLRWRKLRAVKPAPSPVPRPTATPSPAATPAPVETATTHTRAVTDQPDLLSGFQIKAFYVVPADVTDHQLDTNGTLDRTLSEGNAFLQDQIGYHLQIDQSSGGYDIEYLHSRYTAAQLSVSDADKLLMNEAHVMDNPGANDKHFLFFIDVPYFSDGGSNACGLGDTPGLSAQVAVGLAAASDPTTCNGSARGFTSVTSAIWVHEILHTFGVTHTLDDPCDLMYTEFGNCTSAYAIDAKRARYVGAAVQGVDLLTLRVWAGHVNDAGLRADCTLASQLFPRSDGVAYAYCPTGTQQIGESAHCWSPPPAAQLQALVAGSWTSAGSASWSSAPWGANLGLNCSGAGFVGASTTVTVTTPGLVNYRWLINGRVDETFNVLWVA